MKISKLFLALLVIHLVATNILRAGVSTITVSASATATVGHTGTSQIISNQIVIQTNVTAQILHLHEQVVSSGQGVGGGGLILIIQVNGLNFSYSESALNSAGDNKPIIIGPATITLTEQASIGLTTGGIGTATLVASGICTISTNQLSCNTSSQFLPNTGVVIPSDATGPVEIILESSSDMVNWVPSLPGTYGSTYTNRFFRVRAVAQ